MSSKDAADVTSLYQITPADLECVRRFGELVIPNLGTYIELFYEWLPSQPEFDQLFTSDETVQRVKGLQLDYWSDFFRGVVDDAYLARRRAVGEVHARIGLSLPAYFAAINMVPDDFFEGQETQKLSAEDRRSLSGDVVGSIQKGGLDRESRFARLLDRVAAIGIQAS